MSELFQEFKEQSADPQTAEQVRADSNPLLPPCCQSGCTICVLDYPELFLTTEPGSDELARQLEMLEAVEQALRQAGVQ
jgi:hypothetical protein